MVLSKRLYDCVMFARFADENQIKPSDLAELIQLAKRAFSAGERECNTGKSADPQRNAFEAKAEALGFGTEWNGLGPTLKKAGRDYYLPAF